MAKGSHSITADSVVEATTDQMSSELAGEAVILSLQNNNYYGLNEVGACIWSLVQQSPRSVQSICDALMQEFDVDRAQCEEEVISLLQQMRKHNLIEVAESE